MGEIIKNWFTEKQKRHAAALRDLLIEVYKEHPRDLVFGGGTALSFFYGSGRFSDDIDFSSGGMDDYTAIDEAIGSFENRYSYRIINDWENEISQSSGKFRRYFLSVSDSSGERIETRIDYSMSRCELGPIKKELNNDYYTSKIDVMKPEEILAEKVRTLYARQKGRDLYDLHHLSVVKKVGISKSLIFDKFKADPSLNGKKYSFESFENRVENLRRGWNDLRGIISNFESFSFDRVKAEVLAAFRNI